MSGAVVCQAVSVRVTGEDRLKVIFRRSVRQIKNNVSAAEAAGGFPPKRWISLQRLLSSCQSCHDGRHTAATSTVSSCCWASSSSLAQAPGPPRPFLVTILRLWYFNSSPDVFSAPDVFFSCPDVFFPPRRSFIPCVCLGFNIFYLTRLTILRPVYYS